MLTRLLYIQSYDQKRELGEGGSRLRHTGNEPARSDVLITGLFAFPLTSLVAAFIRLGVGQENKLFQEIYRKPVVQTMAPASPELLPHTCFASIARQHAARSRLDVR